MMIAVGSIGQHAAQIFDLGETFDPLPEIPDRMQDNTPAVFALAVEGEPDCPRSDLLCFTDTANKDLWRIAEINALCILHRPTPMPLGHIPNYGGLMPLGRPFCGRCHITDTLEHVSSATVRALTFGDCNICGGCAPGENSRRSRRRTQGRVGTPARNPSFLPGTVLDTAVPALAARRFSTSAAFSFSDLWPV